ncbi:hypothetical protein [Trichormus azollae]|uniref:hypothetical protein n=1 Tax=Trichormus azollae TaxID=1164 RepID=UPI00325F7045
MADGTATWKLEKKRKNSFCPQNTLKSQRMAVAEFIARGNFGIVIGNFEIDFSDGEIPYKTSIDVKGDRPSFALIKRLV